MDEHNAPQVAFDFWNLLYTAGGGSVLGGVVALYRRATNAVHRLENLEKNLRKRAKLRYKRERVLDNRMRYLADAISKMKEVMLEDDPQSKAWTTAEIPVDFMRTGYEPDEDDEDEDEDEI